MAIKYEVIGSEALQRQIDLLKFYPEIFDKHFYPAMDSAAELVKKGIRPNLPEHTGRLIRALGSKVIHSGTAALGTRVGHRLRQTLRPTLRSIRSCPRCRAGAA